MTAALRSLVLGLYCRAVWHSLYIDRGCASCLRCGRRWVGRSYD
jgi:hypothetical protein